MIVDKVLNLIIKDIAKTKVLPEEQQLILIKKVQAGDKKALKELVDSNLRFILQIAIKFKNSEVGVAELINDGVLGLIEGAKRFQIGAKNKFISYAVWWIRQSILKSLCEKSRTINIPQHFFSLYNKIEKAKDKSLQQLGRIDLDFVQKESGCNPFILEHDLINLTAISLSKPIGEDGACIEDLLVSEQPKEFFDDSEKKECKKILNCLDKRSRRIVNMFFGIENDTTMTLTEIAYVEKISKERVRQLKERAVKKMRYFYFNSSISK